MTKTRNKSLKTLTKPARLKRPAKAPKTPPAAKAAPVELPPFETGQKWQYGIGYAEIVHVGKMLIDYRFHTQPNQKRVPITTDIMTEFIQNLKKNKAKLIS